MNSPYLCHPLGPCPIRSGIPPGELWAYMGTPPDRLDFWGAVPTRRCWMMPCPCCRAGWCALLPDGTAYGYRLAAEIGCSNGCDPGEVQWWHLWRLGELPPREPVDERARRYAAGAIRRTLTELPTRPSAAELRRAAFSAGRWLEAGGQGPDAVAGVLLQAAVRAGHDAEALAPNLAAAVLAGRARPGRVPA